MGAALAALGALLALILGVSRTTFAMSRERHFPGLLDAVSDRHGVPHRAELAVGVAVAVLVMLVDLRAAMLPRASVLSGLAVFAVGALVWLAGRRSRETGTA